MKRRSLIKKQKQTKKEENSFSAELDINLKKNIDNMKIMLGDPDDLVIRELSLGEEKHNYALAYVDGMVDKDLVNKGIVHNLQIILDKKDLPTDKNELIDEIKNNIISVSNVEKTTNWDDMTID